MDENKVFRNDLCAYCGEQANWRLIWARSFFNSCDIHLNKFLRTNPIIIPIKFVKSVNNLWITPILVTGDWENPKDFIIFGKTKEEYKKWLKKN